MARTHIRGRGVKAVVFTALGALLCSAPSSSLAATLTPDERETAAVVLAPLPGERIVARVVPGGCQGSECAYSITATGRPDATPASRVAAVGGEQVIAENGARVEVLSRGPVAARAASASARGSAGPSAAAAVDINNTTFNGDNICADAGCALWKLVLNSRSYCDGTYAWGTRSRYGHAGYVNIDGTSANGYSLSSDFGFSGDPSKTDLFAYHSAQVSVVFHGSPSTHTHYLHRHYYGSCTRTYLVGA
jgi:hypothetical protein